VGFANATVCASVQHSKAVYGSVRCFPRGMKSKLVQSVRVSSALNISVVSFEKAVATRI